MVPYVRLLCAIFLVVLPTGSCWAKDSECSASSNDPICRDRQAEDSGLVQEDVNLLQQSASKGNAFGHLSNEGAKEGARDASAVGGGFGVPMALVLGASLALFVMRKNTAVVNEGSAVVAEFVGTFALVFTVGCCVITGSAVWNATAIASVLMVMVYATGPISGGHLNPAVTLSLAMCGKFEWEKVPTYCAAQVVAGIAAGSCFCGLFSPKTASVAPVDPYHWTEAFFVEAIYTFMLCFVVNNCAASRRNNEAGDGNQFFGLAIGFVIAAGGYAAGGVSGAAFNPAVALGLDFSSSQGIGWSFAWVAFEVLGAAAAAVAFRFVRPEDYSDVDIRTYQPKLLLKLVSEFMGVFMLVLTVGLNIATGSASTAWSAAAALMCMIYSLGDVSGGHFNPAVTVAVFLRGKLSAAELATYIPVQLLAGLSAGIITGFYHQEGPTKDVAHFLQPGAGHSLLAAGIAEAVYTFVLCYVVLATATIAKPASQLTKQNFYFALAIGSCVTAGGFAAGAVSGGELNPAVSTGLAVASGVYSPAGATVVGSTMGNLVQLAVWELVGGVLAAVVFNVTHPTEVGRASTWLAPLAAEFVGVFVLVFTVVCNVIAGDSNWAATSIACSLMVMIYATGDVSGGHLNPAVTFALALVGKHPWAKVPGYFVSQLAAGIAAGFAACSLYAPKTAGVAPVAPYTSQYAFLAEVIYTFMLCFTVLNSAGSIRNNSPKDGNNFFALAIGFTIVAGGYAVGKVSGAAFNPAVAIGLDISSYNDGVGWGFAWAVFELVGAAVAALLFRIVRREDFLSEADLERYTPSLMTKLWSEFIGVFMLVVTVGLNLSNGSPATAWSAAAALMCMIYNLGNISGAHLNPAVTVAVVASGRGLCSTLEGVAYVAAQLLAGFAAGRVYSSFHAAGPKSADLIALNPGVGFTMNQASIAELAATMLLAYVVLSCATVAPAGGGTKTQNSFYFALCIGACVTVGGFGIGSVSGGELNPAVALGITSGSNAFHPVGTEAAPFVNFVKLGVWELTGGLLAAVAFQATNAREYAETAKEAAADDDETEKIDFDLFAGAKAK